MMRIVFKMRRMCRRADRRGGRGRGAIQRRFFFLGEWQWRRRLDVAEMMMGSGSRRRSIMRRMRMRMRSLLIVVNVVNNAVLRRRGAI